MACHAAAADADLAAATAGDALTPAARTAMDGVADAVALSVPVKSASEEEDSNHQDSPGACIF